MCAMRWLVLPLAAAAMWGCGSCSTTPPTDSGNAASRNSDSAPPIRSDLPLTTVERVDVKRYMGAWYEIARYDNSFQRGLVGVIARYTLDGDGEIIRVRNTGRKGTLDGEESVATAKGWLVDGAAGAKWEVQFFWPIKADYWIIQLDEDYQWAVVGQPSRQYLWILSRTPTMEDELYDQICRKLREQGYDPAELIKTPQPPGLDPTRARPAM